MKRHTCHCAQICIVAMTLLLPTVPSAQAGTCYWDGGTADIAGNGDGASAGGSGIWSTTIQNWDAGAISHT
ncbi:MAG TPA: hypothetical protein DCS43_14795, partial [Verrucomicrobia bacterium]|nr:hypothetical protein [Verrucomicrobiota bacterium]